MVTLIITLVTKSHDPLSKALGLGLIGFRAYRFRSLGFRGFRAYRFRSLGFRGFRAYRI